MNTAEKIKIMQAFLDGKTITRPGAPRLTWNKDNSGIEPLWNWEAMDYEIQPEPKVIYVNEYEKPCNDVTYRNKDSAERNCGSNAIRTAVKYIEVIE